MNAKRAREIIGIEIEALETIRRGIGKEFNTAVKLILKQLQSGGKIVVTGVGKNFHIGQKISATLASTGSPSVILHPSQAMHGDIGIINCKDILLMLSYNGESQELLSLIPAVKREGVKIVAITGEQESSIARHSDAVIPARVKREACPFNMAPTASTTATLAIGDALAIVLLEARGFKKDDFAKLHPGGVIGKTLLYRISDIMRKGKKLPILPLSSRIKDAIIAMTDARSGCVVIVTSAGKPAGIITDGDLRRLLSSKDDIHEYPVKKVMTRSPITIRENQLAIDALKIYEKHNVDDILVIDKTGRAVGLVDIQDLPKFKIF